MQDFGIDKTSATKIIGILHVLFPSARIYVYGSRARGDYREYSDIDIALDCGKGNKRLELGEAKAVLEALNIPYKIDLVDVNHVSESLREMIKKEGVLWNQ